MSTVQKKRKRSALATEAAAAVAAAAAAATTQYVNGPFAMSVIPTALIPDHMLCFTKRSSILYYNPLPARLLHRCRLPPSLLLHGSAAGATVAAAAAASSKPCPAAPVVPTQQSFGTKKTKATWTTAAAGATETNANTAATTLPIGTDNTDAAATNTNGNNDSTAHVENSTTATTNAQDDSAATLAAAATAGALQVEEQPEINSPLATLAAAAAAATTEEDKKNITLSNRAVGEMFAIVIAKKAYHGKWMQDVDWIRIILHEHSSSSSSSSSGNDDANGSGMSSNLGITRKMLNSGIRLLEKYNLTLDNFNSNLYGLHRFQLRTSKSQRTVRYVYHASEPGGSTVVCQPPGGAEWEKTGIFHDVDKLLENTPFCPATRLLLAAVYDKAVQEAEDKERVLQQRQEWGNNSPPPPRKRTFASIATQTDPTTAEAAVNPSDGPYIHRAFRGLLLLDKSPADTTGKQKLDPATVQKKFLLLSQLGVPLGCRESEMESRSNLLRQLILLNNEYGLPHEVTFSNNQTSIILMLNKEKKKALTVENLEGLNRKSQRTKLFMETLLTAFDPEDDKNRSAALFCEYFARNYALEYMRFVDTAKERKAALDEQEEKKKQAEDRKKRIENIIMYDESDRKNPNDIKWNLNYASLLKFHERHGHTRVPVRPPTDGIIKATGEKKKRKIKKHSDNDDEDDEDEEDLDSLGEISDEDSESDDDGSVGSVPNGLECKIDQEMKELMRWTTYQRQLYRSNAPTLTAKRKELLDKVNFPWTMNNYYQAQEDPRYHKTIAAKVFYDKRLSAREALMLSGFPFERSKNDSFQKLVNSTVHEWLTGKKGKKLRIANEVKKILSNLASAETVEAGIENVFGWTDASKKLMEEGKLVPRESEESHGVSSDSGDPVEETDQT